MKLKSAKSEAIFHINFAATTLKDKQTFLDKKELLPAEQIVKQKQIDSTYYFEVKETGAKLSMREAKLLIESFCALFVDREIPKNDADSSSANTTMNQSVTSSKLDMNAVMADGDESKTSSTENQKSNQS